MAIDAATFKIIYPEFSSIDDTVITVWLDKATAFLSANAWGTCLEDATFAYAAHLLALSQARQASVQIVNGLVTVGVNTSGLINSASAGDMTVSYTSLEAFQQGGITEAFFSTTPYGIDYLRLARSCLSRGTLTGSGC